MHKFFRSGKRDDGSTFVTVADDAPSWVTSVVREAHQGDMPNDWIYSVCADAFAACEDGALTAEDSHEFSDGQVDVYTKALYEWAADSCLSSTFAAAEDEAAGCGEDARDMASSLRVLQYHAIDYIARTIAAAVAEHADDGEDQ